MLKETNLVREFINFSEGSILVDYFVELANLEQKINTQDLKVIFHDSLRTYNANRWNETKTAGSIKLGSFTIDPKYTDFVGMSQYILTNICLVKLIS